MLIFSIADTMANLAPENIYADSLKEPNAHTKKEHRVMPKSELHKWNCFIDLKCGGGR